ncbi:hypothetical protein QZH41_000755 [Actinostola sp. cb2023]|nr:hypothetical protein QZH41_000755 [Actinostola sp. cb2023]
MNGSNLSQFCDIDAETSQDSVAKIMAWSVIAVFGLLGNALTIAVVYREKSLHNTVNYLIVNMAISDLITPLVILPYSIFSMARAKPFSVWVVSGDLGAALCKIFFFTADISPIVSILSLVCITVDRFCAIMFPLRTGSAPLARATKLLVAATWIVSAVFLSPYFYGYTLVDLQDRSTCVLKYSDDTAQDKKIRVIFYSIMCVAFVILPFIVLTFMYTMILVRLRQQDRSAMALSQSKKERIMRYHKTRRVVIMALVVLVVFGVCWGPFNMTVFLLVYLWEFNVKKVCYFPTLTFVVQFLGYANPVFNPVIYFIFIERYRNGLYSIVTCKKRKSKHRTVMNSAGREFSGMARSSMGVGASPRTRVTTYSSRETIQTDKL